VFEVAAERYDRFMGRYSVPLAVEFADFAGVTRGQRVLDVGCGPGALTSELVRRLGADSVAAVDPSEPFVTAARARHPGVDVEQAPAESLPYADGSFDAALAQLVVQFMADPARGVAEMARVTRPGGVVAACIWDHGTGRGPLSLFWRAAGGRGELQALGASEGDLGRLFRDVGLREVDETLLSITVGHESFEEFWEPYTYGVGPAGAHYASLTPEGQAELRERVRELFAAEGPELTVSAWAARGRA
jgi:SAM-dependent methyltransferase